MATGDFAQLVTQAQQGDADAMERLLKDYGDAIQTRQIRFCLLDQRLRRVVGESDVFQSVIAQFAFKLREGQYHFETPSDLVGLLKTMARAHVAQLARFWQARQRDLRKDTGLDAEGVAETPANDPTASTVVARVELLRTRAGAVVGARPPDPRLAAGRRGLAGNRPAVECGQRRGPAQTARARPGPRGQRSLSRTRRSLDAR